MKKVAILQSNYIPWKGYFDIINSVDTFVIYDEVQYTKRDWRNRNLIKSPEGLQWLTIPVEVKGKYFQKINETLVSDKTWMLKHWKSICQNYKKAPFFKQHEDYFFELYTTANFDFISEVNLHFINGINKLIGIKTEIIDSRNLDLGGDKNERLIDAVKKTNGTHYLSGPAAKSYMDVDLFNQSGIEVEWMSYTGYKEYPQLFSTFEHGVSILDLIFNVGTNCLSYLEKND
jgi:hypothetical protein